MKKLLIILVLIVSCQLSISSQSLFSGRVVKASNPTVGVSGAIVSFYTCIFPDSGGSTCSPYSILAVRTNSFGYFNFTPLVWDNTVYPVVITSRTYQTNSTAVSIFGDTYQEFQLVNN